MATIFKLPCSMCQYVPTTDEIRFCSMHSAAPALLEALKRVSNDRNANGEWDIEYVEQAIAQAEGRADHD